MPTCTAPSGGRRRRNFRDVSPQPQRGPGRARPVDGPVRALPMLGADERACRKTVRRMSRRARALVARVPCLDRATAERAALGYPVDWSRYVDEAGEPRDVALPPATI